ncbi:MAG: N-acetyl sugar amidotransferase, partial [Desulfovibrionaceae bacterium]
MTKTMYGLPEKVVFCKRCITSNQRPSSIPEFMHKPDREGAHYMNIDEEGICDACRFADEKESIDWEKKEQELLELLDKHRSKDGSYDCIVPGSGGKDSAYAAHLLKYKYGMHPLTVTWPPILYTDYGYENWKNWVEIGGFDNIVYKPNGRMHRLLTKLSIQNLLHPFQTFILGQKNMAPKLAAKFGIELVFYGENPAEYGNPIADNETAMRDRSFWVMQNLDSLYLAGLPIPELMEKYNVSLGDLMTYLPIPAGELDNKKIEVRYLGYYVKWIPQEAYYYAVEHTGFQARPFRTEGTYSKYNSIDDKIDDLHYYTTHIKFGIGRTVYDASQEIWNRHLTREEALALARQYDGERPKRYLNVVLDYIEMTEEQFDDLL